MSIRFFLFCICQLYLRSLGSRMSRRLSPKDVNATVVRISGNPPANTIQEVFLMNENPSFRIVPQLGVGGRTPRPRKLSPASTPITSGTSILATINTGPITLGRICKRRMRYVLAPIARCASINSALRSYIT